MGLFDDAVPGGNIGKPLMIALGALLVGKMLSGKNQPQRASARKPAKAGCLEALKGFSTSSGVQGRAPGGRFPGSVLVRTSR